MVANVERPPATYARSRFDVGGVLLDRPFRIRRLGHFGVNVDNSKRAFTFTVTCSAFRSPTRPTSARGSRTSSAQPWAQMPTPRATSRATAPITTRSSCSRARSSGCSRLASPTTHASTRSPGRSAAWPRSWPAAASSTNQGIHVRRSGRDTPGSNWHTYPLDPDGHTNELYYGIEQVGWTGYSKPRSMYNRGFRERPSLPQMSEFDEVDAALGEGVNLESGFRPVEKNPRTFDVDGILLARPFKIVRIGPVRIFVDDVAALAGLLRVRARAERVADRYLERSRMRVHARQYRAPFAGAVSLCAA